MTPPEMAGWNLTLRFLLELSALVALGVAAWNLTSGAIRWVAVVVVPLGAAAAWGVFNVLDDPSRSGAAPVEVPGWTRLVVEGMVFGGAAIGLTLVGRRDYAIVLALLVAVHYATSWSRVEWLLKQ